MHGVIQTNTILNLSFLIMIMNIQYLHNTKVYCGKGQQNKKPVQLPHMVAIFGFGESNLQNQQT